MDADAAFGSTFAREAAYTDHDWHRRLHNPIIKTFVAVRLHDRRVLSATSLIGPMPHPEPVANPSEVTAPVGAAQRGTADVNLHFQLTGVYTRAEARGQGLALAAATAAVEHAHGEALRAGRECRLGVDVYATNTAAISFYERCGFVVEGPRAADADAEPSRPELLMFYNSHSYPVGQAASLS
jgi:GNAT superfamily N-acetyltransferase